MDLITSTKNTQIKNLLQLEKARNRKKYKLFIIEGYRETDRALRSGYEFDKVFYCPELDNFKHEQFIKDFPATGKFPVADNVFSRIAYRDNNDGILAVAKMKKHSLESFTPPEKGLYLVIESVEKPGNLGAILRTADAAGTDALFICDNQTDLYNPNVVRSSLGCLFSNKVIKIASEEAIRFFKENNISVFSSALQNSTLYYETDFTGASAIVLGSEAHGLSDIWRKNAERIIRIPMAGIADSLNVSSAAAILVFEAVRQRKE